jgi:ferredoxin
VLKLNSKQASDEPPSMGVFTESLHNCVKKLAETCPEKALIIEKIEQKREKRV